MKLRWRDLGEVEIQNRLSWEGPVFWGARKSSVMGAYILEFQNDDGSWEEVELA